MDHELEIEVEEEKKVENTNSIRLPVNFINVGNIEPDDVKIYIHEDVLNKIEEYSSSNVKKELGSILVGDISKELGKTHVVISDFIEAKYTDASAATLTFTHESWEYINSEHEKNYKNKKIIGWQHTHPNYGIFLSSYDMFIQENFFNLPFQIAYVIDPIQKISGFFQWKNGKVQKCTGYYIYNDLGKRITYKIKKEKNPQKEVKKNFNAGFIIQFILIAALSMLFWNSLKNIENKYNEISINYNPSNEYIKEVEKELPKEEKNVEEGFNGMVFKKYLIEKGDTLITICEKNDIDINEFRHIIKSINGIENENEIFAGKVILLPIEK